MILTIGPGGCGFTFLNWSITYLRGDEVYVSLTNKTYCVTEDPLHSNGTAHNQQKDHITSITELPLLDQATEQSVVYVVPTHQSDIKELLPLPGKKIIFDTNLHSDKLMARTCCVVPNTPFIQLIKQLSTKYNKQIVKQILIESNQFFTKYYQIDPAYKDCIKVDYDDIFENLDQRIFDIFTYLELQIVPHRLTNWQTIYQQYRSTNKNWLKTFLNEPVSVDNATKTKIIKELIQWKNG